MITRRGFIGVLSAVPVAPIVFGDMVHTPFEPPPTPARDDLDLRFNEGPTEWVPHAIYAKRVLNRVNRHLRDLSLLVVGGPDMKVGSTWGSGFFHNQVFAGIPGLNTSGDEVGYDRLVVEDIALGIARKVRELEFRFIGRLPLLRGMKCSVITNPRISLRFLSSYDIDIDATVARFDILGGKG